MKAKAKQRKFATPQQTFLKMLNTAIIDPLRKNVFNEKYKMFILLILSTLLATDIFMSSESSDIKFFGITIAFFITTLFYKLKSKVTFVVCLVLLALMYGNFLISGPSKETEKIAVWLFFFMVVGIIQQWKE